NFDSLVLTPRDERVAFVGQGQTRHRLLVPLEDETLLARDRVPYAGRSVRAPGDQFVTIGCERERQDVALVGVERLLAAGVPRGHTPPPDGPAPIRRGQDLVVG